MTFTTVLMLTLPMLVVGCGPLSSEEVIVVDNDTFYSMLTNRGDYNLLSLEEIVDASVFIGLGRIVSVADGMTVRYPRPTGSDDLRTLVLEIEVDQTIKGDESRVYVQRLDTHEGSLKAYLPADPEVAVFLEPVSWREPAVDVEYVDVGAGYPPGGTLHRLTTPQGLLIVRDGLVVQPLAPEEHLELFPGISSLQEVGELMERAN